MRAAGGTGMDTAGSEHQVFASLRFNADGPITEARDLQQALGAVGVKLHIIDVSAGSNISTRVFSTIETCSAFIAFGSASYGEDTGTRETTHVRSTQSMPMTVYCSSLL